MSNQQDWHISWRVGVFDSSSSPGTDVLCLAEGDAEIAEWEKRSDFRRWLGLQSMREEAVGGKWEVVNRGGDGYSDIDVDGLTMVLSVGDKTAHAICAAMNAHPQSPAVPDARTDFTRGESDRNAYNNGWNDCRKSMLSAQQQGGAA